MKSKISLTVLAGLMACVFFVASFGLAAEQKKAAKKEAAAPKAAPQVNAATVNGTAITQAEVQKEIDLFLKQAKAAGQQVSSEQEAEIKKGVLDSLINREVVYQESQKQGLKVSDGEVDERLGELKKGYPNDADYQKALQTMGLTEPELKKQVVRQLAMKKLIDQAVIPGVSVSDDEVKKYYDEHPDAFKMPEQVRASHILKKVDTKASDEDKAKARKQLADLQERIKKGEDFAALAKENSDCPSAPQGGDLGFFQRGQMVPPFETAAFALKPGDLSDIVETQFGYHLIKVTDKKAPSTLSFDESKERITQYLKREKVSEQVSKYVEGLKTKATIKMGAT